MPSKFDMSGMQKKFDKLLSVTDEVMPKAYKYFKSITPKRSGYARAHTKLRGNEIVADYRYAGKLDEGSSNQAPTGMTEPTEREMERLVNNYIKKVGK